MRGAQEGRRLRPPLIRRATAGLAIFLVVGCSHPPDGLTRSREQSVTTSRLAEYMAAQESEYWFSGAVLVARGDKVLLRNGYGFTDLNRQDRITPSTRFPLASATKPVIATAVAMLMDKGLLDFDDPICDYLPDCPRSWKEIRISNLLDHTSGIPALEAERTDGSSLREVVEEVATRRLTFRPGADYTYSNSNYWLAGHIVELVSHVSWPLFLEREMFAPQSMNDTAADDAYAYVKGFALTRSADGERRPVSERFALRAGHATPRSDPAGGLVSTVDDLYMFVRALDRGELLSPGVTRRMWTPRGPGKLADYGLGWESFEQNDAQVVQHGGAMPGYSTCLSMYPEQDLYVVVLSNLMEVIACEYVARDLGAIVLHKAYDMPRRPRDVNVPREVLMRYSGTYVATEDIGTEQIEISVQGSSLVMRGLASVPPPFIQRVNLTPFSSTEFFNPQDPEVRIGFERSESGRMTLLVRRPPYKRFPAMTESFLRT